MKLLVTRYDIHLGTLLLRFLYEHHEPGATLFQYIQGKHLLLKVKRKHFSYFEVNCPFNTQHPVLQSYWGI